MSLMLKLVLLFGSNWTQHLVTLHFTMFTKDGLDGKKMQGKSKGVMRTRSVRSLKRAPT